MAANKPGEKPPAEGRERRVFERVSAKVPALFSTATGRITNGTADQLGENGLFLGTESVCPLNSILNIQIQLPEVKRAIRLTGRVVYTNPYRPYVRTVLPPGMGVKFVSIADEDRSQLVDFIRSSLGQDKSLVKVDVPARSRPPPPEPKAKESENPFEDAGESLLRKAFGNPAKEPIEEPPKKERPGRPKQKTQSKTEPQDRRPGSWSLWNRVKALFTKDLSGDKEEAEEKKPPKKPPIRRARPKRSLR